MRWDRMTSTEIGAAVASGIDMGILPVGATEQHGPHLATGTDFVSAETVALRVAEKVPALVLPTIPYGCSLGHTDKWPGTLSLHPATLTQIAIEIGRWAIRSGLRKLLFLSGHGTNAPCLGSAVLQLRYEEPQARFQTIDIFTVSARVHALYNRDGLDFHANRGETSVLMHIAPDMVRPALAFDVPDVTPGLFWRYDMPRTTPTGVVGRPTEADEADGVLIMDTVVSDLATTLTKAALEDWPNCPPGP